MFIFYSLVKRIHESVLMQLTFICTGIVTEPLHFDLCILHPHLDPLCLHSPDLPDLTTPKASASNPSDTSVSESVSNDGAFQVITQEEVTKSIAAYDDTAANHASLIDVPK